MAAGGSTSITKVAGGKLKGSRIVTKSELAALSDALGVASATLKEKLHTVGDAGATRSLSALRSTSDGSMFLAGGTGAPAKVATPPLETLVRLFDFRVEREGGSSDGKKGWRTMVDGKQVGEGFATIEDAEKTKQAALERTFETEQQELRANQERRAARIAKATEDKKVAAQVPVQVVVSGVKVTGTSMYEKDGFRAVQIPGGSFVVTAPSGKVRGGKPERSLDAAKGMVDILSNPRGAMIRSGEYMGRTMSIIADFPNGPKWIVDWRAKNPNSMSPEAREIVFAANVYYDWVKENDPDTFKKLRRAVEDAKNPYRR